MPCRILRPSFAAPIVFVLACLALAGCSGGPTRSEEIFYVAVPSGDNVNFYRMKVEAGTQLGVTKYQSGWFPADTVDRLFGDVSESGSAAALKTEQDIRQALDSAIKDTAVGYLEAAKDPDSSSETIMRWLQAQRRVRAIAGDGVPLPEGAVEIEYDPGAGLALRHAGQKLVFVLSSNPDQVMQNLRNFAGSKETSASVLRLADVVRAQAENRVVEAEAEAAAALRLDALVVRQIDAALANVENAGNDRDALLDEVRTLLILLETLR